MLQDWPVSLVVEVAGNQDMGVRYDYPYRINRLAEALGDRHAERTAIALAAIATWGMDNEDMQRVVSHSASADIENVAGWAHTFNRCNANGVAANGDKGVWAVEQSHIDAAKVG